jgi:hypothetical protein
VELPARSDAELAEGRAEVSFDRLLGQEQPLGVLVVLAIFAIVVKPFS